MDLIGRQVPQSPNDQEIVTCRPRAAVPKELSCFSLVSRSDDGDDDDDDDSDDDDDHDDGGDGDDVMM